MSVNQKLQNSFVLFPIINKFSIVVSEHYKESYLICIKAWELENSINPG